MKLPTLKRRSLQAKFLSLILTILLLLSVLITLVFINYQVDNQKKLIYKQANAFSDLSVRPIGNAYTIYFDSGLLKFKEITGNILGLDQSVTRFQIIGTGGNLLYDSQESLSSTRITDSKLIEAVNSDKPTSFKSGSDVVEIIQPYFDDFGSHPFSIKYFVSYSAVLSAVLASIPLALLVILLVAIGSGLVVIFTVNRTIISPIEKIVSGAGNVSKGELDARISLKTGDELETLASAVNNMASSLQKNIEDLKDLDRIKDEFIIIASHNLRTPITIIKGYVNQLIAKGKMGKEEREPLENIAVAVSNLEGLIEEILNIVSLETNKKISSGTQLDLASLIGQVISFHSKQALEKKIALQFVSGKEKYLIKGDVTKLKIVFNNIIENAIKFNKEGGSVTVKLSVEKENVLATVADTGIGISEKEIPLVFNKFHRATDILQYNYQGLGLGLYLAMVIVEAHQGKIRFESKSNVGSTFYISLPKSNVR